MIYEDTSAVFRYELLYLKVFAIEKLSNGSGQKPEMNLKENGISFMPVLSVGEIKNIKQC